MPAKPYAFLPKDNSGLVDLSTVRSKISEAEAQREKAFEGSRRLHAAIVSARASFSDDNKLETILIDTVGATATREAREANLSYKVEDFLRHQAFLHFLTHSCLLPPSQTPYATDEEYLSGACMGLARELERYGLGMATARDVVSLGMAKSLLQEILEYLLSFDFRNGPLRRKYDGIKYCLKALETLLYELAVTGTTTTEEDDEKPAKVQKKNSDLLANEELKALRERMEHRDNLREKLIKRCRDGQKAAKQAIFALHRGDPKKAKRLIDECEDCIQKDLLPIVQEEPQLRNGCFGNVLEEYVEAKLFYVWLFGTTATDSHDGIPSTPPAKVLTLEEFAPLLLEPNEYLGGLCDLTGEIGRFAVQRATVRDASAVKICLATNKCILTELQMMDRYPKSVHKKMDQLQRSSEKLERILYEMSLSEAAGGRNVQTSSMDIEPESANSGRMDDT